MTKRTRSKPKEPTKEKAPAKELPTMELKPSMCLSDLRGGGVEVFKEAIDAHDMPRAHQTYCQMLDLHRVSAAIAFGAIKRDEIENFRMRSNSAQANIVMPAIRRTWGGSQVLSARLNGLYDEDIRNFAAALDAGTLERVERCYLDMTQNRQKIVLKRLDFRPLPPYDELEDFLTLDRESQARNVANWVNYMRSQNKEPEKPTHNVLKEFCTQVGRFDYMGMSNTWRLLDRAERVEALTQGIQMFLLPTEAERFLDESCDKVEVIADWMRRKDPKAQLRALQHEFDGFKQEAQKVKAAHAQEVELLKRENTTLFRVIAKLLGE